MSAKKSTILAKQQQQHFKWYYAVILIGIVAIVGILVLRFSHAGVAPKTWTAADKELLVGVMPNAGTAPTSYNVIDNGMTVREIYKANDQQSADPQIGVNTPIAAGTIACIYAKVVNLQNQTVNYASITAPYEVGFSAEYRYGPIGSYGIYTGSTYFIGGGEPGVGDYHKYCVKSERDSLSGSITLTNDTVDRSHPRGSFLLHGPYKIRVLKIVQGDTSTKFK